MSPDEALRRRLESLNRGPLPAAPQAAITNITSSVATADKKAPSRLAPPPLKRASLVKPIPGLLRRGEVVANEAGEHLRICLELDQLWPGGEKLVAGRHQRLVAALDQSSDEGENCAEAPDDDLRAFIQSFPRDVVLLDLETCGLAGSALFLVGLLRSIDDRPTVELLLARNYAEERAVLASLWRQVHASTVLATFNGKSFDWPMVLDRTARYLLFRGSRPPTPQHVDLLHAARRRWKHELPDCRLLTIEERVCGRRRGDDIPGSQIPAAYQQYVRTGFERDMDSILLHNAADLVTLLDIAMRLAGPM